MTPNSPLNIRGFQVYKGFLGRAAQESLVAEIRTVAQAAPFFSPVAPSGKQMSVRMTSAGRLGWVTDRSGYRYQADHPSGRDWPAIPDGVLAIWRELGSPERDPDSCLVNFYGEDARMGMHQDKDEGDFSWPVVSISLGDDALFRMGNPTRGGKTESLWLTSGDVVSNDSCAGMTLSWPQVA